MLSAADHYALNHYDADVNSWFPVVHMYPSYVFEVGADCASMGTLRSD